MSTHVCVCIGMYIHVETQNWCQLSFLTSLYLLKQGLLLNLELAPIASLLASLPQDSWCSRLSLLSVGVIFSCYTTCPAQLLCGFWRSAVWASHLHDKNFIHRASSPAQSHHSAAHKGVILITRCIALQELANAITFEIINLKDVSCFTASETQQLIRNQSPRDVTDGLKL